MTRQMNDLDIPAVSGVRDLRPGLVDVCYAFRVNSMSVTRQLQGLAREY